MTRPFVRILTGLLPLLTFFPGPGTAIAHPGPAHVHVGDPADHATAIPILGVAVIAGAAGVVMAAWAVRSAVRRRVQREETPR